MAFTTVAYSMARAGATAALTIVTPVADAHVTITATGIVIPKGMNKLFGAVQAYGTGLVSPAAGAHLGQLQSPSLRRVFQQELSRVDDTFAHETHQEHYHLFPDSPLPLDEGEELQAWTAHPACVGGETAVYVFLADGPAKPVSGEIRTIRFTSVCAPLTRIWTLGLLGVVQPLPMGTFAVVGARVCNLTEYGAFRLIFTGYDWRPGGIIHHGLFAPDSTFQRDGYMGEWGRFNWLDLPRIEICSVLAAPVANPVVYLDLIKVS